MLKMSLQKKVTRKKKIPQVAVISSVETALSPTTLHRSNAHPAVDIEEVLVATLALGS